MSFRPLHDRVVVRRVDSEEKTKGGIIIPDTQGKASEGVVVSVGPGPRRQRQDRRSGRQGRRPRAVRQVERARGQAATAKTC